MVYVPEDMFATTPNKTHLWKRIFRLLAAIFACVFVCVSVTAALHTHSHSHGVAASVSAPVAKSVSSNPGYHAVAVSAIADCALCDYLQTPFVAASVTLALATVLTALAALALAVRLAALCAAPAPRRGLRAPPVFLTA